MIRKNENSTYGYYNSLKHILGICNTLPGVTIDQSEEKIHAHLEYADSFADLYMIPLFPGITLLGMDCHMPFFRYESFLPASGSLYLSPEAILEIRNMIFQYKDVTNITKFNYCHCGRTELLTGNDVYVYMKEHEFAIDRSSLTNRCDFPQGYYLGFGFIIEDSFSSLNPAIAEAFHIDMDKLCSKYLNDSNQFTYITRCSNETLALCEQIFNLSCNYQKTDIYRLRALVIQLITAYQFATETSPIGTRTYLTKSQICIAKNVAEQIRADLSLHTSAKKMAADYNTSETSLKNYFREVYGENLSAYRNRLRMEKAAELLQDTSLCVSAIAEQVGYLSQSKFAAAFKKYYEVTPVEFRRNSALSAPDSKK